MKALRDAMIRAGLDALSYTGAHRLFAPHFGGVGVVMMMHHVRPARPDGFQPNRHLEITPEFLRTTLRHLRAAGFDFVGMDEARRRLRDGDATRRFAAFSFDDGFRDNRDHALPVMREFVAPMTVYVASDFADGQGVPWWIALERAVAAVSSLEVATGGPAERLRMDSVAEKQAAFLRIHDWLRTLQEADLHREITALCRSAGVDAHALSSELCMDWNELREFAKHPLITIGAHTVTHCNLAQQTDARALHEMRESRSRIENALQRPALHIAYPYGDRAAAGPREFRLGGQAGFVTGVTTRPGMLFTESRDHLMALPRLSLNGNYQDARYLPVLTSGAATAMYNGFRRTVAA